MTNIRGQSSAPSAPHIRITSGVGSGGTALSAFDAALRDAGVSDFNLVRLSSIIPPGSRLEQGRPELGAIGGFGDLLHAVYAVAWVTDDGSETWAGLTWARDLEGSGSGLFVEHTADTRAELENLLSTTLTDMIERRDGRFAWEDSVLRSARCSGDPACVIVMATYQSTPWQAA